MSKPVKETYEEHNAPSARVREERYQCQCAACKTHRQESVRPTLTDAEQQPGGAGQAS